MTVFVVTWNLNKEKSNYNSARDAFIKHLERYENIGDPGLESTRFISTSVSARQLSDDLQTKIDKNDRLVVSAMRRGEYFGWLTQPVWTWIEARV